MCNAHLRRRKAHMPHRTTRFGERGEEATKKKKKKCSAGSVHQTHTAGTGPFGLVCVTNPKGPVPRPSGTRIRVHKRGLLLNGDIDK